MHANDVARNYILSEREHWAVNYCMKKNKNYKLCSETNGEFRECVQRMLESAANSQCWSFDFVHNDN